MRVPRKEDLRKMSSEELAAIRNVRARQFQRENSDKPFFDREATGLDLSSFHWDGEDFAGCDLSGAKLNNCTFKGADFRDAKLWSADLRGSDLSEAKNLLPSQLSGVDLTGANLP